MVPPPFVFRISLVRVLSFASGPAGPHDQDEESQD